MADGALTYFLSRLFPSQEEKRAEALKTIAIARELGVDITDQGQLGKIEKALGLALPREGGLGNTITAPAPQIDYGRTGFGVDMEKQGTTPASELSPTSGVMPDRAAPSVAKSNPIPDTSSPQAAASMRTIQPTSSPGVGTWLHNQEAPTPWGNNMEAAPIAKAPALEPGGSVPLLRQPGLGNAIMPPEEPVRIPAGATPPFVPQHRQSTPAPVSEANPKGRILPIKPPRQEVWGTDDKGNYVKKGEVPKNAIIDKADKTHEQALQRIQLQNELAMERQRLQNETMSERQRLQSEERIKQLQLRLEDNWKRAEYAEGRADRRESRKEKREDSRRAEDNYREDTKRLSQIQQEKKNILAGGKPSDPFTMMAIDTYRNSDDPEKRAAADRMEQSLSTGQLSQADKESLISVIEEEEAEVRKRIAEYRSAKGDSSSRKAGGRTVVRTGTHNGRKVVQYSDGTIAYGD